MRIDFYSYILGGIVAMSYMLVPRLEKTIDILVSSYRKWRLKKNV